MHRWFACWGLALAACGFPRPPDVAECAMASDCTSPGAPLCASGTCVAACQRNADCDGAPGGRLCQTSTGACVGCRDASDCSAALPICDGVDHRCRGCVRDDDCPGGICLEPEARCVADASVVFVDNRGRDSGDCTRDAPCNLVFALSKASPVRNRLEVLSGVLGLAAPVTLTPDLYIEGSDTIVTGPNDMFTIAPGVSITLSHLRIQPTSGLVATVGTGRGLRLFDVQTTGGISVVGGTLDVDRSVFTGGDGITCMAGTLTAQRSHFDHSAVGGTTCQLIVRRSRFDMSGDGGFGANGGVVTFENNLIIQSEGIADSTALVTVAPASVVRFNTFVNTAALASDGLAMSCDSTIQVSSNIFAYGSMHPLSASCRARYSLFDSVAVTSVTAGVGNKTADGGAIFADKPAKDFHLSPSSPARGAAESGLPITDDFDGNPRPSPAGAAPDIGAFEAH